MKRGLPLLFLAVCLLAVAVRAAVYLGVGTGMVFTVEAQYSAWTDHEALTSPPLAKR